ncbi:MAG: hypothetical protein JWM41_4655 [Gemmatimonadetes bacterium]|nr:hypothetical protein [Gemmatimonadota bacterium]
MKPAVVFVLTFVIATAASTGAKVALTKTVHPPRAEADSSKSHKDSTQTDTAIVASGLPVTPPTDSAHPAAVVPVGDSAKAAPAAATPATAAPGAVNPPPLMVAGGVPALAARATAAAAAAAANDTMKQASEKRIAKVFTSMDAKQAAKVLEHMTDTDVQVILGYVGPRQAASIMTALPPERVATLSKLAMQGKK